MAHPYQTTYQSAALNQAFGPDVAHGQPAQPPQAQSTAQGHSPFGQQQQQQPTHPAAAAAAAAVAAHYHQLSSPPSPALPPYAHDHAAQDASRGGQIKRKGTGVGDGEGASAIGKRRKGDDGDDDDEGGPGGGLKHWTDDDKTKLFTWLMGPGQDEHFNALRASKNSCLRECAQEAFGGKKSFQALKGALERAFATFKQIYAFEASTAHLRPPPATLLVQAERHRDWERRINAARKSGLDLGSISIRLLEQWHKTGWYQLFYSRWHGDPQTTKPLGRVQTQVTNVDDDHFDDRDELMHDPSHAVGAAPPVPDGSSAERELSALFAPQPPASAPPQTNALGEPTSATSVPHAPPTFYTPQPSATAPPMGPPLNGHGINAASVGPPLGPTPGTPIQTSASTSAMPGGMYPTDATLGALVQLAQAMMGSYVQLLKTQAQDGAVKMEYLRRREEREEAEHRAVRERERRQAEREQADWEHARDAERIRHRATMARELLETSSDPSVKAAAAEYLKKLLQ